MLITKAFRAAVAVCLSALTGCVNFQVDEHSYQFNEATGSLSLRLLLLNAVRASKDYPLQFTKISAYQGQGTSSASLSASLPIPTPGSGTLSPKLDLKDGISELTLVDLSTEEAQTALRKTIPWNVYDYFYKQIGNRSYITPFMLLVEAIAIAPETNAFISSFVEERCEAYLGGETEKLRKDPRLRQKIAACEELRALKRRCPNLLYDGFIQPNRVIVYKNETTSECHFNAFVAARLRLTALGGTWGSDGKAKKDKQDDSVKKGGATFNIYVADPKKDSSKEPDKEELEVKVYDPEFMARCSAKLCVSKPKEGFAAIKGGMALLFRTPERVVRYLGDLIAAQSYGPKRYIPEVIDVERGEKYKLLVVTRGIAPPGGAAVAVRSPEGEMFYVPRRDPDAPRDEVSLETLSIATDILNLAVTKKAFPEVTTLRVKGD